MELGIFGVRITTEDVCFVLDRGSAHEKGDLPGDGALDLENVRLSLRHSNF